jgi:ferredoxin
LSDEMRVEIDVDTCTGHGRCYELAPNVFTDDERGYGQVAADVLHPDHVKEARAAMANCPERAIRLRRLTPPQPICADGVRRP